NSNLAVGTISETGRALDVALQGKNHLFQIQVNENGVTDQQYTRDGAFYLQPLENSNNVMLVTKDGHPVLGDNGPIVLRDGFDDMNIQSDRYFLVIPVEQLAGSCWLCIVVVLMLMLFYYV